MAACMNVVFVMVVCVAVCSGQRDQIGSDQLDRQNQQLFNFSFPFARSNGQNAESDRAGVPSLTKDDQASANRNNPLDSVTGTGNQPRWQKRETPFNEPRFNISSPVDPFNRNEEPSAILNNTAKAGNEPRLQKRDSLFNEPKPPARTPQNSSNPQDNSSNPTLPKAAAPNQSFQINPRPDQPIGIPDRANPDAQQPSPIAQLPRFFKVKRDSPFGPFGQSPFTPPTVPNPNDKVNISAPIRPDETDDKLPQQPFINPTDLTTNHSNGAIPRFFRHRRNAPDQFDGDQPEPSDRNRSDHNDTFAIVPVRRDERDSDDFNNGTDNIPQLPRYIRDAPIDQSKSQPPFTSPFDQPNNESNADPSNRSLADRIQRDSPSGQSHGKVISSSVVESKAVVVSRKGENDEGDKHETEQQPDKLGTFVSTSGTKKACSSHSDCYGMREPDEWCPLDSKQQYLGRGCYCNSEIKSCIFERLGNNSKLEYADCVVEEKSKCFVVASANSNQVKAQEKKDETAESPKQSIDDQKSRKNQSA